MRVKRLFVFLCVLCCTALLATVPSRSEPNGNERITGTFVSMSGRTAGRSRQFTLIAKRYTAPNELRELNEALSRGQDELLKAMSKMDAGQIQIGTGVGVPANVIIADPWNEGGRRVTVLYARWLQFFELRYGTRSQDYPIGYAEMYLDRNGRGEGTLIPAARVRLKGGNTWEVEDFGTFPARLMGLRSSGRVEPR